MSHQMQASRFEYKYIVPEQIARAVKKYSMRYLVPDDNTNPDEFTGYSVYSLYLDSPDYKLCRATLTGEKNRFKLRIRFYDTNPDSPVFFEIKRRVNDIILKQRAGVWRSSVPRLLAGHWPTKSDLVKADDKNWKALHNFCNLRNMLNAGPTAYTAYLREAYWSPDSDNLRVTFDRELHGGDFNGELSVEDLENWPKPRVDGVVLELKFTDRFPDWMHTMVQIYQLPRGSMPKYVECVAELGKRKSHSMYAEMQPLL